MPLQSVGLRVAILGGNIDPRKREDWILKRVNTIDALICNPRLVETGMDLVQFATVVFFETGVQSVHFMAKPAQSLASRADPIGKSGVRCLCFDDGGQSILPHGKKDEGCPVAVRR